MTPEEPTRRSLRRRAVAVATLALAACCALAAPPAAGDAPPAEGDSAAGTAAEPPLAIAAPRLTTPPAGGVAEAPEGHLLASWEPVEAGFDGHSAGRLRYQLQTSRARGFEPAHTIDVGADRASFLSGLRDGDTHLRVRAVTADGVPGPWSDAGTVRVAYHDLALVGKLFALGAVTLVCLLTAIVTGVRRTAAQRREAGR